MQGARCSGSSAACATPPTSWCWRLEDEHGLIDVILRPQVAERHRALLHTSAALRVAGRLQRAGAVISVLAWQLELLRVPGADPSATAAG